MDKKELEIPFGAFDSELMHQEINIPEGFEAEIKGDKIILTKTESKDEKVIKELITHCRNTRCVTEEGAERIAKWIAFLEKQGGQKLPIEKLPSEMKTIGESLGFTTQEEYDKYNQMVSDSIMSDGNEIKPKFKVGDTIRLKNSMAEYTIESISGGRYYGRGWCLNIIDADKSGDYILVEQNPANKMESFCIPRYAIENIQIAIKVFEKERHAPLANALRETMRRLEERWKPTDLQLECLSDAIERYNSEGYPADVLKTLLRQLKQIG